MSKVLCKNFRFYITGKLICASCCSTVVKHSKVKGLSLAAAVGSGRENVENEITYFTVNCVVAIE